MKIFIDFDDVLFNTRDFKEDLLNVFIKNGITKEQFKESYWGKTYNLERQIKAIEEDYGINADKLEEDIDIFLRDLQKYIFVDVEDFLKSIGKENIFLTSYGHKNFQEQKIKNSSLMNSFKKVVITHDTKSGIIKDIIQEEELGGETLYFLDDRIKYVEEVKNIFPDIRSILIKRPEGRYDDEPNDKCDFVANNLKEVKDIIIKNKK